MNSKGRSSAAWCAEPQPVETGLSVDDRPNELNIAFWVISSVGAASPLLLHIIYVSVRAPSLSFSISLALSFHAPPNHTHKHIAISFSRTLCCILFFSLSLSVHFIPSQHLFPQSPSFRPLVSLFLISPLSFLFSFFSTLSLPLLFYSLYLCLLLYPFLPQQLPVFFFCLTLSEPFFLSSYLSLWASLSSLSHFLSLFPSLSFLSHAYEVALHCVSHPLQYSEPLFKYYSLRCYRSAMLTYMGMSSASAAPWPPAKGSR